ncbi:MAG: hypothetical protein FRX48_02065 [Lasallia pustulata]|uniref:AMP-activated protein kinase glycogen-binding domain-containing protein n=1 Tax=Lasallia pustulata TaxID=136370 RepID=A0A5M8PX87_9LECA|nr:MAG: hypothetical protein FRX48_02065 [Lasallia pustulata]
MTTPNIRPITITYKHPGARPPVYVAGSFTAPAWEPQELKAVPVSEGDDPEYVFSKQFDVAVGDWQYKFRLGEGDWWACDENTDITTDKAGNQNNVLVVKPQPKPKAHEDKQYHGRPHPVSRGSGQAWDSTGSSRIHDDATEDRTDQAVGHSHNKKHCNLIGHHTPNCSAHGVSSDSKCICNPPPTPSEVITSKEKSPAIKLPYSTVRTKDKSQRGSVEKNTQLPAIPVEAASSTISTKSPVIEIGEVIDREDDTPTSGADKSDMDGITKTGNGEISAAHAESIIEVLMSIPDVDTAPKGTTTEEPMANSEPAIVQSTSHDLCPLFPHERLTRDDPSEAHHTRRKSSMSRAEEGRHQSPEYPQLEVFPSGTGPILKRIATTKSQLDADETTDETLSAEEDIRVTELVNSPTFSHERCPAEQSILYREDMFSSDEDRLVAKDLHEGTLKSNVHKVHDLAGVDGCADLQPIEEEHAMDAIIPTRTSVSLY